MAGPPISDLDQSRAGSHMCCTLDQSLRCTLMLSCLFFVRDLAASRTVLKLHGAPVGA